MYGTTFENMFTLLAVSFVLQSLNYLQPHLLFIYGIIYFVFVGVTDIRYHTTVSNNIDG